MKYFRDYLRRRTHAAEHPIALESAAGSVACNCTSQAKGLIASDNDLSWSFEERFKVVLTVCFRLNSRGCIHRGCSSGFYTAEPPSGCSNNGVRGRRSSQYKSTPGRRLLKHVLACGLRYARARNWRSGDTWFLQSIVTVFTAKHTYIRLLEKKGTGTRTLPSQKTAVRGPNG